MSTDARERLFQALFEIASVYNIPLTNNPDMHRKLPSPGDFCSDVESAILAAGYQMPGVLQLSNNVHEELAEILWDESSCDWRHKGPNETAAAILAAGYRKPPTIDNDKLLIQDRLLLLDVGGCTCTPYGSSHEPHCGLEYVDDLTKPLERAGYRKPRTITTTEELDTLPSESLILDAKNVCREGLTSIEGRNWWRTMGPARVLPSHEVPLPATLLHEGSQA